MKGSYNTNMSESQPKDESEYVPLSPVMRYYNDINATMSEVSIVMAMDNLVDSLPIETATMFQTLRESAYMPFDWEIEHDQVIAKEKLAMLPLYAIGPELENSDCDLDDLKEWYRDSLRGIRMVTQDIHTKDCLSAYTDPTHEMCDFSTTCPQRSMQYFLLHSAKTPDFSKDIYKTAPKREFTIVKDKLALAMSQSIISFDMHEILVGRYAAQYNTYMSKRSLSKSDRMI
jgi:hypothetical protein